MFNSDSFIPEFNISPENDSLLFDDWRALAVEAGTTLESPDVFKVLSQHLLNSDLQTYFNEAYPVEGVITFMDPPINAYYVYLSAMQKAIRFGLAEEALKYFRSLNHNGFIARVYTRLGVIFLEDIGVADPFLCSFLLECVSKSFNPPKFLVEYLIVVACRTTKTRVQTEVLMPLYQSDLTPTLQALQKTYWSPKLLIDDVLAGKMSNLDFMVYMTALRGSKSKELFPTSQSLKSATDSIKSMCTELGMPALLTRLVNQSLSVAPSFCTSMVVAWSLMSRSVLKHEPHPFQVPSFELVGKVLSAAFDQHTRPGQKAIYYVMKSHPKYFEAMPVKADKYKVFGLILFEVEGAYLHNRISSPLFDAAFWGQMVTSFDYNNWDHDVAVAAHHYAAANMEPMHHARRRIWT